MNSINPPSYVSLKHPVVWNEDVYALGRDSKTEGKLFKYSTANNDWSAFSITSSIYASGSVLTTYYSKLLLISGKDMTVWEFSSNNFVFESSSIKPIPSTYLSHPFTDVLAAISKDEYLIVFYNVGNQFNLSLFQLIYDGRNWKQRQFKRVVFLSNVYYSMAIDSRDVVIFEYEARRRQPYNYDDIYRAPTLSVDGNEDTSVKWETGPGLEVISCAEFGELLSGRNISTILHNRQLYFVNSQGVIWSSFIQPPIVPVVWGKSGVEFQRAPNLVGLPNGTMLMIGIVGDLHQSQIDVIKVSHLEGTKKLALHIFMSQFCIPIKGTVLQYVII